MQLPVFWQLNIRLYPFFNKENDWVNKQTKEHNIRQMLLQKSWSPPHRSAWDSISQRHYTHTHTPRQNGCPTWACSSSTDARESYWRLTFARKNHKRNLILRSPRNKYSIPLLFDSIIRLAPRYFSVPPIDWTDWFFTIRAGGVKGERWEFTCVVWEFFVLGLLRRVLSGNIIINPRV